MVLNVHRLKPQGLLGTDNIREKFGRGVVSTRVYPYYIQGRARAHTHTHTHTRARARTLSLSYLHINICPFMTQNKTGRGRRGAGRGEEGDPPPPKKKKVLLISSTSSPVCLKLVRTEHHFPAPSWKKDVVNQWLGVRGRLYLSLHQQLCIHAPAVRKIATTTPPVPTATSEGNECGWQLGTIFCHVSSHPALLLYTGTPWGPRSHGNPLQPVFI